MSQVPRSELSKATLLARKNKGKEQEAEILRIFFGIHTENAILMLDRIRNKTVKAA